VGPQLRRSGSYPRAIRWLEPTGYFLNEELLKGPHQRVSGTNQGYGIYFLVYVRYNEAPVWPVRRTDQTVMSCGGTPHLPGGVIVVGPYVALMTAPQPIPPRRDTAAQVGPTPPAKLPGSSSCASQCSSLCAYVRNAFAGLKRLR
jgi:hypothetical protein